MEEKQLLRAIRNFEQVRVIGEITVELPKPPADYKKIAGWDLPRSQQRFTYTPQPSNKHEPPDDFIAQEFDRFENGYWFFNNGNLEWLTPCNYFFLNYWSDKGKKLRFIDAQQRVFHWWWQIEQLPNFAGGNLVASRRLGKTVIATCIAYFRTTTNANHRCGMQSKTNKDGKVVFSKLVRSWRKLPAWLQPKHSGENRPATMLEFAEPRRRSAKNSKIVNDDVLDSSIDYQSSEEDAYDGEELNTVIEDECHIKGVEVIMHDGSIKKVENVVIGDLLMGDDGTPRRVLSLRRGTTNCYQVLPKANGWYSWGCTANHVLSVVYGNKNRQTKFKDGEVYNIRANDFLKLSATDQKHFSLYRKPTEYQEKDLPIPAYILGTWLGDGTAKLAHITTPDAEIINAWKTYAHSLGHFFGVADQREKYAVYKITGSKNGKGSNYFLSQLQSENLIDNKHIPEKYLFNSRKNRLELLAGLLDTDGYKEPGKNNYEIVQKRKDLAYDIQKLASELGFKSNIKSKIATMKRADGSVYKCEVYRVNVFGLDLHEIPCRVKRKICTKKERHKNARDSKKTSFKLSGIGEQEYFGFQLDGNNLYLLKDCTVTHNCGKTISVNTDTRWGVLKFCLLDGTDIVGKAFRTSTVEDMEKRGGKHLWTTWQDSQLSTIDPETNQTTSLLTNLLITADWGLKGTHPISKKPFIDEYGYSQRELAASYIESTWKKLSGEKLKAAQRKMPLNIRHAFQIVNNAGNFDPEIYEFLETQKQYLNGEGPERAPDNLRRQVTFFRNDAGLSDWKDDPKGHSSIIWDFPDKRMANARLQRDMLWKPNNEDSFCGGCDPFAATIVNGPGSMGVLYIYRKGDVSDPDNSGLVICRYAQRTRLKEDFHRMVMTICQYYGCKVNYECDVDDYYEDFLRNGFKHYVMWRPKNTIDPQRKNVFAKYGTPSKDPYAFQKHFQVLVSYLWARWHKIYFIELVEQLIKYDVENRTEFDEVIAFGMALLGGFEDSGLKRHEKTNTKYLELKKSYGGKIKQKVIYGDVIYT